MTVLPARTPNPSAPEPVLRVENLAVSYHTRRGEVRAVRDVSFEVHRGEIFGLVGESGSGKSTVAFSLVNFLGRTGRITGGRICFLGQDLTAAGEARLAAIRGDKIAMVYQDPSQALNPSLRVGEQLCEVLETHRGLSRPQAHERALEMLCRVHLADPGVVMERYPHQLSGGQQQRLVIAMALLAGPDLLILDEPTTALDVTVQAAVLDLVEELGRDAQTAVVYITHDLAVVARTCHTVGVMYAGELVERGSVQEIFRRPRHPYTAGLLRCLPALDRPKDTDPLRPIEGRVPAPGRLPPGCAFAPRCELARADCDREHPDLREVEPAHLTRCLCAEEVQGTTGASGLGPSPSPAAAPGGGPPNEADPLLTVEELRTCYEQRAPSLWGRIRRQRQLVRAVDGVSLSLPKGATLGIVGESGCGKSTLVKTLAGLEEASGGRIELLGVDVTRPLERRSFDMIRLLQMVFQNPDSTLNPSFSVGYQIARSLRRFRIVPRGEVRAEVVRLLQAVRLNESYYHRLPSQLSGGEKQRAALARAIAARPELLLCDEPLSALDVSVQAAILNLLVDLQREYGLTLLFIAHDLAVVRFLSDFVAVMYLGHICETGRAAAIYEPPYHPYTEALLSAVPIPDPGAKQKRVRLEGAVPSPLNPPKGCPFHTRCPRKRGPVCEAEPPPLQDAGNGHRIWCHIPLAELRQLEPVVSRAD